MNLMIRAAREEDASLLANFSRKAFYDTFAAANSAHNMDLFMNSVFSRDTLMKEVGAPGHSFFIALDGRNLVGYAGLREKVYPPCIGVYGEHVIEISRLYVDSALGGQGIGKALMEKCLGYAKRAKKEFIWLGVWENNNKAIHFYSRWGFEKIGSQIFMLGTDAQTDWIMGRAVGPDN